MDEKLVIKKYRRIKKPSFEDSLTSLEESMTSLEESTSLVHSMLENMEPI